MALSSLLSPSSFSRHLMCKDHDFPYYNPIEPTTTFRPTDVKAECLTTVWINDTIEFRWYYRDNSSRDWVSSYNWSAQALVGGPPYHYAGYLLIAGYWPGVYYPRAYKVDVYLDGSLSFSEFFEVTNGGLESPRVAEDVDANGQAVNMTSRFTVGVDTQVCHYLRFDNMAYFNEETGNSHNFTTVWVQPNGTVYKTHSSVFNDYKDDDLGLSYWSYGLVPNDSISINSSTPIGNWKVEVYVDSYFFNSTWKPYGPVATTPFIVGNQSVADWTFMVYIASDNGLANASIGSQVFDLGFETFLKMANVTSSPKVNIVAQIDRGPSLDERYGNWTDCKRFNITKGTTPTAENAVQDLGEVNMGDPSTLRNFITWTIDNYPADFLFLVLWDHGSGVMGVCEDLTNGNDFLSLPEIGEALQGIPAILDDVLIDACSMSMLEVAYQIKDSANVLIGPEGLGYAPAPYDDYLSSLLTNTSMSPSTFANVIVMNYTTWCLANSGQIHDATMAATDLTKIASLIAAVDAFAITLKDKETLYHEQLNTARTMTNGYPGPYAYQNGTYQTGFYIDLYDLAFQVNGTVSDQKARNVSVQVMASIASTMITVLDINDPGTHGLAVFFPDGKEKYAPFSGIYEVTAFASDTPWDEFVRHHLSGFTLTIQTHFPDMPVKIDEDFYNTTGDGEIRVFLQPGHHIANVTTLFSLAVDPKATQAVFLGWENGNTSCSRMFIIENGDLAAEAQYELQYLLRTEANLGYTDPPIGTCWRAAGSNLTLSAVPPLVLPNRSEEERYVFREWVLKGAMNLSINSNPANIAMNGPINATAVWTHEYSLTVASHTGISTKEWHEVGAIINRDVASPFSNSTGAQYVCTGWIGTGSAPSLGNLTAVSLVLNEPSEILWCWKTQYQLTLLTDPKGLSPQPSVSPVGPWYDSYANVTCAAQQIGGYAFQQWSAGDTSWGAGINPIVVTIDKPYIITASYVRSQAWYEILIRPDVMQAMLALLGTVLTLGLIGGTWVRSRKRRDIVKTFLAEIDDVYFRLKAEPKKCEEALYTLRNTILEGMTDGRISEDNYDILDKRIDKYVTELSQKLGKKRRSSDKQSED